ncbi:MAG: Ig-like domain-containing protein, partial [candidate division KSB1 bacterium]|nr:Ig-like domain-containing protein [candidate division KSB1 bacterium]
MKLSTVTKAFFAIFFIACTNAYPANPLQVVSVNPKGDLSGMWEANQISVTFNMPVIPLEKQRDYRPDWFVITPAVEGDFQWIGTETISFRPAESLDYATQYRVEIKSSLTAVGGSRLTNDYIWTFATPTPFIQYSYPHSGEESVDIKSHVSLFFNIPVFPSELYQYARFHDDAGRNIAYEINSGADSASTEMQLKPRNDLKIDTRYTVNVSAGLRASEGDLGSKRSWTVHFRTYDVFKFVSLNRGETKRLNPKRSIRIAFTNPVEYAELIKHIRFEPAVTLKETSYSYSQSDLNIYGPYRPDTSYTILISGELTDVFGNKLGRSVKAGFTTRSYDPKFKIPAGESVVEAYGNRKIPVDIVNLRQMRVKVKSVPFDSVDILGSWFSRQRHFSREDVLGKSYHYVEKKNIDIVKNERYVIPVDLTPYLKDGRHGILIAQLDAKETGDSPTPYKLMMTQVTDLGVTAKFSPVSNGIYVTTLKDAAPVA